MFRFFFQLRYVAAIVLFVASYSGYHFVKVELSDHERSRNALANELAERVANELPLPDDACTISIARLIGDEDKALNEMLRHWLRRHGHRVTEPALLEQIERYFGNNIDIKTPMEADHMARIEGTQYVVYGDVQRLCTTPGRPRLDARLKLYGVSDRKVIVDAVYSVPANSPTSVIASVQTTGSRSLKTQGIVVAVWLVVLMTLPIMAARPIAHVLRKRSNCGNAAMLTTYVLFAAVSAWISWASLIDGWIAWSLLLVGTPCTATYFAYICRQQENGPV